MNVDGAKVGVSAKLSKHFTTSQLLYNTTSTTSRLSHRLQNTLIFNEYLHFAQKNPHKFVFMKK